VIDPIQLLFWMAVTFFTPVVLALAPLLKKHPGERTLHAMLGVSAGLLIGVVLLDILPESFRTGVDFSMDPRIAPVATAAGFFTLLLVERYLMGREEGGGHFHVEDGRKIQPYGTLAVSALAIHGVMDGVVVPFGLAAGQLVGTVITLAMVAHQIPDSFAALSVGLASESSSRRAALYVVATATDTPLGIVFGAVLLNFVPTLLPIGLGFSAGTFLFVSAADLLPELQHKARSKMVTASIFLGFTLILLISMLVTV